MRARLEMRTKDQGGRHTPVFDGYKGSIVGRQHLEVSLALRPRTP